MRNVKGILGVALALAVVLVLAFAPANAGEGRGGKGTVVTTIIVNPDRDSYLVLETAHPMPGWKLADRLVLGEDGTTITGFRDRAAEMTLRNWRETLVRMGRSTPIPIQWHEARGTTGVTTEAQRSLMEKPVSDCTPSDQCLTTQCFPSCDVEGHSRWCNGDCLDCREVTVCG
ncbi:MAG: hypothetical protein HY436_00825 [Candidatus Liptonbacteria bacterium]|nr:hypothetical protein [Candidatus Liptonbacteria bacterium]